MCIHSFSEFASMCPTISEVSLREKLAEISGGESVPDSRAGEVLLLSLVDTDETLWAKLEDEVIHYWSKLPVRLAGRADTSPMPEAKDDEAMRVWLAKNMTLNEQMLVAVTTKRRGVKETAELLQGALEIVALIKEFSETLENAALAMQLAESEVN